MPITQRLLCDGCGEDAKLGEAEWVISETGYVWCPGCR